MELRKILLKGEVISCDSMIFSYHFHGNPTYSLLTSGLFQLVEEEKITLITSVVSYLETLSYKNIEGLPGRKELIKQFFLTQKNLSVLPVTIDIAEKGASLRRSLNLKAIDAIQLSTSLASEAKIFLTNDKHFKKIEITDLKVIFLDDLLKL